MTKLFLDSANLTEMDRWSGRVHGFTTNPSLMRKAGVLDYEDFACRTLAIAEGKPVSFEVIAEDTSNIVRQAQKIAGWADNVYVKVPVVYIEAIRELQKAHVPLNITCICNPDDVYLLRSFLDPTVPTIISVFAGRIADTGRSPYEYMRSLRSILDPRFELLWASTRELYNIKEAEWAGVDIITVGPALLDKLDWFGRDLDELTQATVKQFIEDGRAAGYKL